MSDARSLLDHPIIAQRYFFPRRAPLRDPYVVSVPGAELHCGRRVSYPERPVVLFFHGNGEVVDDWHDFDQDLDDHELNSLFAEYRGYGGSTGEPQLATMLDDAVSVAKAAGDPKRLIVYGRSVGSLYALHVASVLPVGGLVIESGISDLEERLLLRLSPSELGVSPVRLRSAVQALFDQRAKVEAHAGPVLILHTLGDQLVSADHARRFAAWAGPRAQLCLFDRGDHNSIHLYNRSAIVNAVVALALRLGGS